MFGIKFKSGVHELSSSGHISLLVQKLEKSPDKVHKTDKWNQTPLHCASANVKNGHECAQILLDYGATLNATDCDGRTPLHCCCSSGSLTTAMLLLEKGADIAIRDYHGKCPMDVARNRHKEFSTQLAKFVMALKESRKQASRHQIEILPFDAALTNTQESLQESHHQIFPHMKQSARPKDRLSGQKLHASETSPIKLFKVVYSGGAPVREGLELTSKPVGILLEGDIVPVSEQQTISGGVVRVHLADGSGWTSISDTDGVPVLLEVLNRSRSERMSIQYHRQEQELPLSSLSNAEADPPQYRFYRVVYSRPIPIRASMDILSKQVSSLEPGDVIEVSEIKVNAKGIRRIKLADGRGWTSLTTTNGQTILAPIHDSAHSARIHSVPQNSSTLACSSSSVSEISVESEPPVSRISVVTSSTTSTTSSTSTSTSTAASTSTSTSTAASIIAQSTVPKTQLLTTGSTIGLAAGATEGVRSYKIVYPAGAPVRSSMELQSDVRRVVPCGEIIDVVEECRNSRNILRLKLADGTGWTSLVDTDGVAVAVLIDMTEAQQRPEQSGSECDEVTNIEHLQSEQPSLHSASEPEREPEPEPRPAVQSVSDTCSPKSQPQHAQTHPQTLSQTLPQAQVQPQTLSQTLPQAQVQPQPISQTLPQEQQQTLPQGPAQTRELSHTLPQPQAQVSTAATDPPAIISSIEDCTSELQRLHEILKRSNNNRDALDYYENRLVTLSEAALAVPRAIVSEVMDGLEFDSKQPNDLLELAKSNPKKLKDLFANVQIVQEYYRKCLALISLLSETQTGVTTGGSFEADSIQSRQTGKVNQLSSQSISSAPLTPPSIPPILKSFDVVETIRRCMREKMTLTVETCFHKLVTNAAESNASTVSAILDAASYLIQLIVDISAVDSIDTCLRSNFEFANEYFSLFSTSLKLRFEKVSDESSTMTVEDMLTVIDWIDYFHEQVQRFELQGHKNVGWFSQFSESILEEYQHTIKQQVLSWFDNMQRQPLEVVIRGDLTLATTNPEDMFRIIIMQLKVAEDHLSVHYMKFVVISCLQVLGVVQRRSYDRKSGHWASPLPEIICAIINDSVRLHNKSTQYLGAAISRIPDPLVQSQLREMLSVVADEFLFVAGTLCEVLASTIITDLQDPVIDVLFGADWESGQDICGIIIITFEDYFADISQWLSPQYFQQFCYWLLAHTTRAYTMALTSQDKEFIFQSEVFASVRINEDAACLFKYFEKYEESIRRGKEAVTEAKVRRNLGSKPAAAGLPGRVDGAAGVGDVCAAREEATNAHTASIPSTSPLPPVPAPSPASPEISTTIKSYNEQLAAPAVESTVMSELLPLYYLSSVINCESVASHRSEVAALVQKWGEEGQQLARCAVRSNPSLSMQLKKELCEELDQLLLGVSAEKLAS